MKKFLSILALVLVVAMCASFAASADKITSVANGSNTATSDATLTYKAVVESQAVYSVDVAWTDLAFNYDAGTKTWNPTTHADDVTGAGWLDTEGNLTVTNHSNKAVNVTVAFTTANNGDATVAVSDASFELLTAVNTAVDKAPAKTVTLTASGVPTSSAKLGTVKVTVAAK